MNSAVYVHAHDRAACTGAAHKQHADETFWLIFKSLDTPLAAHLLLQLLWQASLAGYRCRGVTRPVPAVPVLPRLLPLAPAAAAAPSCSLPRLLPVWPQAAAALQPRQHITRDA
jgi:hypothetical protein